MQLHNEFIVAADPERAWHLLTDLEAVATCLPGATLLGVSGEEYRGSVQVKVGPIRAAFEGTARFEQRDDAERRAIIVAAGKDPRGQAAADARITAQVLADGAQSRVIVDTDLNISGRLAQFGRGAVADVSARLMTQFADNLNAMMSADESAAVESATTAGQSAAEATAARVPPAPSGQPTGPEWASGSLDAAGLVGPVLLRRYGPYAAVAVIAALITRAFCGRRRPTAPMCACR